MDLILVRHGQTDSNLNLKYCGQTDSELNETGRKQVADSAKRLYNRLEGKCNGIYSSYLRRAFDSAKIIASTLGLVESEIVKTGEILEANFGIFEDLTYLEIMQKYPNEFKMWKDNWEEYVIENGESNNMVYDRAGRFFKKFIDTHDSGVYIFVTHMGVISHAISSMLELGIKATWRFRVDNAGIAVVRVNKDRYCYLTALNA